MNTREKKELLIPTHLFHRAQIVHIAYQPQVGVAVVAVIFFRRFCLKNKVGEALPTLQFGSRERVADTPLSSATSRRNTIWWSGKKTALRTETEKAKAALHAYANDLDCKSQIALRDGDRTAAFRLAEFAQRYVDAGNPNVPLTLLEAL